MPKLGSKLKCMMKLWRSSSSGSSSRITRSSAVGGSSSMSSSIDSDTWQAASSFIGDEVPAGLHPVYVGKSRRRYLVNTDLVEHPLFKVLVEKSGGSDGGAMTVMGCEVVLFEHLLWMLENADPKPDSLDELLEFYAC